MQSASRALPNALPGRRAAAQSPAAPPRQLPLARAASAAAPADPQRWTALNKPVVREAQTISYGVFLADVRALAVKEVVLAHEGTDRAVVVYKDGRVRYCQFPAEDPRLGDVMATYGVVATQAVPEPALPDTPAMRQLKDAAMYWIPAALVFAVYAVVQHGARNKGDWDDRVKLRELAERERKELQEQQARDAAEDAGREGEGGAAGGDGISIDDAQRFLGVSAKRVRRKGEQAEAEAADEAEGKADAALPARRRKPRSTSLTRNKAGVAREATVTFADVAGIGAAKVELMEVVDFFLKPEKYTRSGSKVPRGVLLVGPPGTGKTLLARAVAGEAGVDFFSITASEFVEMFVGVGAARVRSLFEQARLSAPAIVFIDELDAVGRKRGGGGSGNDERDQTLNQLLSELDGFGAAGAKRIVVIAATNRPDVLDAALVRPGRFDRKVYVAPPDAEGRLEILRVHSSRKPLASDVDWATLAAETRGFTGAALANLVNVAALLAAREQSPSISNAHLLSALEAETLGKRLPAGAASRGEELDRRLAVHRAAEALAAEVLPELPGVELLSVEARESSVLGFLRPLPDEQREASGMVTAALLRDSLIAALLPRAAEALLLGGAEGSSTLNAPLLVHARDLARAAVNAGFATHSHPALGRRAVAYVSDEGDFLGAGSSAYAPAHLGLAAQRAVDAEVAQRMDAAYETAQRLAEQHRQGLEAVAGALQGGGGTLSGSEVRRLLELPSEPKRAMVDV